MVSKYGTVQIGGTFPAAELVRGDPSGNGPGYVITNFSPITRVFLCDIPSPDLQGFTNVSILAPGSYAAVDGKTDIYGITMAGGSALVNVTPGASSVSPPPFQYSKKAYSQAAVFGNPLIPGIPGQTIIVYSLTMFANASAGSANQVFQLLDTASNIIGFAQTGATGVSVLTTLDFTPNGVVLPIGTGFSTSTLAAGTTISGTIQYLQGVV